MNPYLSLCDDFGATVHLNTKMELPNSRETVLHFLESLRKTFPEMTELSKPSEKETLLEEDRDTGVFRFVALDEHRLTATAVNPPSLEDADALHERVLDLAPCHLNLSTLDCEALDLTYTFDLLFAGNHDEAVAEAFLGDSPLATVLYQVGGKVLHHEPSLLFALDESCRLQAQIRLQTRTTAQQVRLNEFPESPITIYFTVRQFWGRQPFATFLDSWRNQRRIGLELLDQWIVPNVVKPLAAVIQK